MSAMSMKYENTLKRNGFFQMNDLVASHPVYPTEMDSQGLQHSGFQGGQECKGKTEWV